MLRFTPVCRFNHSSVDLDDHVWIAKERVRSQTDGTKTIHYGNPNNHNISHEERGEEEIIIGAVRALGQGHEMDQ